MEGRSAGRYDFIDLVKGFGIFLVVWGHSFAPRSVLIYSFHMPLFFFISGFLHKDKPFKEFARGKAKRLLLPYAAFSILSILFFLAVQAARAKPVTLAGQLPRILSIVLGTANNGGNDSIWFLPCLFVVGLLFLLIRRLRPWTVTVLAIMAASAAGYLLGPRQTALPFKVDAALSGLAFYALGFLVKEKGWVGKIAGLRWPWLILMALGAVLVQIAGSYANTEISGLGKVAMVSNNLGNYFFFYLAALAGIAAAMFLAGRLQKLPVVNYLGANSLLVLALHKPLLYLIRLLPGTFFDGSSPWEGLAATIPILALCLALVKPVNRYLPWIVGNERPLKSPIPSRRSPG